MVRLYDLLVIRKDEDGTFSGVALDASMAEQLGGFVAFSGARSGMLGDDDLKQAGEAMNPGTIAALIVYENAWAIPFVGAALEEGGALIASARIPATDVIAALDALDRGLLTTREREGKPCQDSYAASPAPRSSPAPPPP